MPLRRRNQTERSRDRDCKSRPTIICCRVQMFVLVYDVFEGRSSTFGQQERPCNEADIRVLNPSLSVGRCATTQGDEEQKRSLASVDPQRREEPPNRRSTYSSCRIGWLQPHYMSGMFNRVSRTVHAPASSRRLMQAEHKVRFTKSRNLCICSASIPRQLLPYGVSVIRYK